MVSNSTFNKIARSESSRKKYVAMPTESTISSAQDELGFQLPKSYREFALRFGAGSLADSFRIFAPLPKKYKFLGAAVYDLVEEQQRVADSLAKYKLKKQKSDFRLFCTDEGGIMYVWDTLDVTDVSTSEYRIYQAIYKDEINVVASSFDLFVKLCCLGKVSSSNPPEKIKAKKAWTFTRFEIPPR